MQWSPWQQKTQNMTCLIIIRDLRSLMHSTLICPEISSFEGRARMKLDGLCVKPSLSRGDLSGILDFHKASVSSDYFDSSEHFLIIQKNWRFRSLNTLTL